MAASAASESIIVVTGGDAVLRAHTDDLPPGALVIAADSGIEQAMALGLHIDVAVGDFDSVSRMALESVAAAGAVVERHPEAKDASDLELALDAAVARGARRVYVLGGHGGRLDHLLANALLLAAPRYAGVELVAQMGDARVRVVHRAATLTGRPGSVVTILAVGGPAEGVTTVGLRYPLHGEVLDPGSTRGLSNLLIGDTATVELRTGVLLTIQPTPTTTDHRTTP